MVVVVVFGLAVRSLLLVPISSWTETNLADRASWTTFLAVPFCAEFVGEDEDEEVAAVSATYSIVFSTIGGDSLGVWTVFWATEEDEADEEEEEDELEATDEDEEDVDEVDEWDEDFLRAEAEDELADDEKLLFPVDPAAAMLWQLLSLWWCAFTA